MKSFLEYIAEGMNQGSLYHACSPAAAEIIVRQGFRPRTEMRRPEGLDVRAWSSRDEKVEKNFFKDYREGKSKFIPHGSHETLHGTSFTRSFKFAQEWKEGYRDVVIFEVDAYQISRNNRIVPVNWNFGKARYSDNESGGTYFGNKSASEEFVLGEVSKNVILKIFHRGALDAKKFPVLASDPRLTKMQVGVELPRGAIQIKKRIPYKDLPKLNGHIPVGPDGLWPIGTKFMFRNEYDLRKVPIEHTVVGYHTWNVGDAPFYQTTVHNPFNKWETKSSITHKDALLGYHWK